MGRARPARVVGGAALRLRRTFQAVTLAGAVVARAVSCAARAAAGAVLSFSGLACAPAAAYATWGVAGLLWVACPVLILAGAAVERAVSGGAA